MRRARVVGNPELAAETDPVRGWDIGHPWVSDADVVGDHVHDHADVPGARFRDQPAILLVVAVTWIDLVEIGGRITVIGALGHRIFEDRIQPQLGEPQIAYVVEVRADTGEIAAVPAVVVVSIRLVGELWMVVVAGVAVGETVGRDQVDRVGGREAFRMVRIFVFREEFVAMYELPAGGVENDVEVAGFRVAADVEIHEQVVRAGYCHAAHQRDAGVVDRRPVPADVRTRDH